MSVLRRAWVCGFYASIACFAHFTWQRLQPLPVRQLYDTVSLAVSDMPLESNTGCCLAKEEQPDLSFLHSNPSSAAVDTVMYVRSNSRTTDVLRVPQLDLVSVPRRYSILEDFGPSITVRNDWPGFVLLQLPQIVGCGTVGIFNGTLVVS